MANLYKHFKIPKRIAVIYNKFHHLTSKLHKTSASIGFIKKTLFHRVTPKFAEIKGQFINQKDRYEAERRLITSHLNKHIEDLKAIAKEHEDVKQELYG